MYFAEKTYSPKKVISPRKPPLSPKGAGLKRNLPPKTLANYFKMPSKQKGNDGTVTSQEKNKGRCHYLVVIFRDGKALLHYCICGENNRIYYVYYVSQNIPLYYLSDSFRWALWLVVGGCVKTTATELRGPENILRLNFSTLKDMLKCLRQQMLEGMFPNFSGDQIVLNADF